MKYRFIPPKTANILLAGSAILLLASCLPAPAPTNAPTPKSSSYAELSSALTVTPGSSPNEEYTSTSLPGEPLAIVSSATQTFPTATPTSDLGWSSHVYGHIAFRYPEHWKLLYIHEEWKSAELWTGEFHICVKEPDKDIGVIFHYTYSEDDPTHRLAHWAEKGMYIREFNFNPRTVVDGGNIVIAGHQSSILTAQGYTQGYRLTAQVTYLKPKQTGKTMGFVWYAPAEQWDAMGEIFSEILASITIVSFYYTRDGSRIFLRMPDDWSSLLIDHPEGKGTWFQSADHKIGMLIRIMPEVDPSRLLADWTPGKLSRLGFSNCSAPIPGEQMKAVDITADSMQGNCLDDSRMEVTYKITYIEIGNNILEVVTYFPSKQSERAWILSVMFGSIREVIPFDGCGAD